MADASRIEWTDATWNPIRARNLVTGKLGWHCTHVSEGCRNCYAEGFNRRLGTGLEFKPQLLGLVADDMEGAEVFLDEAMLRAPLRWKKPRRVFVGSMSDLFGEFVTDAMLDRIFAVMALCPQHTFQVLTKRAARMRRYLSGDHDPILDAGSLARSPFRKDEPRARSRIAWALQKAVPVAEWHRGNIAWPLPNVWLGVSAEDQAAANERIPELLRTPAAVRFISAEPLLGPIDLADLDTGRQPETFDAEHLNALTSRTDWEIDGRWAASNVAPYPRLDWVIVGGESGPHARPMHPDWARQIRDACAAAGTAFFFKQWGEWAPCPDWSLGAHIVACGGSTAPDVAWPDGTIAHGDEAEHGGHGHTLRRVGKKAAGRLLDGAEHNAMPAVR